LVTHQHQVDHREARRRGGLITQENFIMAKKPKPITDTLKAAIKASGLTHYALAKVTGVTAGQLDRFVSGERDLRLSSAAAVAAALGMELRPV
jgi:plasmid maintenance system antidote protein VapI